MNEEIMYMYLNDFDCRFYLKSKKYTVNELKPNILKLSFMHIYLKFQNIVHNNYMGNFVIGFNWLI